MVKTKTKKNLYSFTWSTRSFYSKTPKGKIKRIKPSSLKLSQRIEIIRKAPNWVKIKKVQ